MRTMIVGGPLHGEEALFIDGTWLIATSTGVNPAFSRLNLAFYRIKYDIITGATYFRWYEMDPNVAELAYLSLPEATT
jgi:hypothetical protein